MSDQLVVPAQLRRLIPGGSSPTPPPVGITQPVNGAVLLSSVPLTGIKGYAPPGSVVSVTLDGGSPANVTADASGQWQRVVAAPPAGVHTVAAQIGTDPPSAINSASITFTVQPPPSVVAITSPAPGAVSLPISAIRGTAAPHAMVVLQIDGNTVIVPDADDSGAWSYSVSTQPSAGSHTITVTSGSQTASVTIEVPGASTPTFALTVPTSGSTVGAVDQVAGTAAAGSVVSIQIDRAAPLSATTGADGTWRVLLPDGLQAGQHTIDVSSGGQTLSATITVGQAQGSSVSQGIPDSVWLAGAAALALWWAWRTFGAKRAAPQPLPARQNPSSMVLQSVVVSKDLASTESQAHQIASKFARGDAGAADETSTSFRFRQQAPDRFVPGSLRTIRPTNGVAMIMGHLQ